MDIIIKPLTPQLLRDYLTFFDSMVFSENPDWVSCYCYHFYFTGPKEAWSKENNKTAITRLIMEDKHRGYLAYDGDKVIGWCNANNQKSYLVLDVDEVPDSKVFSVVCFLISPEYRGKGVAGGLLKRINDDCIKNAYDYIEAYPRKDGHSCENNYHGPLAMFQKNGFDIVEEMNDQFVVRKYL